MQAPSATIHLSFAEVYGEQASMAESSLLSMLNSDTSKSLNNLLGLDHVSPIPVDYLLFADRIRDFAVRRPDFQPDICFFQVKLFAGCFAVVWLTPSIALR